MRLLIFILTYNHEKYIEGVLRDIPAQFKNSAECEILIIDDASKDRTCDVARSYAQSNNLRNVVVMKNARNQGYGGNQKVGYRYAIDKGFDAVAMVHGDGQYTPKVLPELVHPMAGNPNVACVLGVRFGKNHSPIKGGMPLYKFIGNRILTMTQNWLARANLSEWHTGYRVYSTRALDGIAFELNTNDFHFDTEILLQLLNRKESIVEFNIPTHYGDEICNVNGLRYGKDVLKASLRYRLQEYNLFYDIRFHPELVFGREEKGEAQALSYSEKFESVSPHSVVCTDPDLIPQGSRVLDIGCSTGYVAEILTERKNCQVTGVDILAPSAVKGKMSAYHRVDLEREHEKLSDVIKKGRFDRAIMLDVLEHLTVPEVFLLNLYRQKWSDPPKFVFSTGNVAFFVMRIMLLLGQFNYGEKGILDITHKRLFSLRTFRNLMEQTGFKIEKQIFLPFPFRELGFPPVAAKAFEGLNLFLIKISPSLFSYQVMFLTTPLATPEVTLSESMKTVVASR